MSDDGVLLPSSVTLRSLPYALIHKDTYVHCVPLSQKNGKSDTRHHRFHGERDSKVWGSRLDSGKARTTSSTTWMVISGKATP